MDRAIHDLTYGYLVVQYRPLGKTWTDDRWDRFKVWENAVKHYKNCLREETRGWEWRIIRRTEEIVTPDMEDESHERSGDNHEGD